MHHERLNIAAHYRFPSAHHSRLDVSGHGIIISRSAAAPLLRWQCRRTLVYICSGTRVAGPAPITVASAAARASTTTTAASMR